MVKLPSIALHPGDTAGMVQQVRMTIQHVPKPKMQAIVKEEIGGDGAAGMGGFDLALGNLGGDGLAAN